MTYIIVACPVAVKCEPWGQCPLSFCTALHQVTGGVTLTLTFDPYACIGLHQCVNAAIVGGLLFLMKMHQCPFQCLQMLIICSSVSRPQCHTIALLCRFRQ